MDKKQMIREVRKSSDRVNGSVGHLSSKRNEDMESERMIQQREEYGVLLLRPEWKSKRQLILKRDNHRCLNCGSKNNLQVHHRQYHKVTKTGDYKRPWNYKDKYLVTLCLECHTAGHTYMKIPVFSV